MYLCQVKNETAQFEDKAKPSKQQKTKKTACAVYDEAIASDESSDFAIIQAATGCQVMVKITYVLLQNSMNDRICRKTVMFNVGIKLMKGYKNTIKFIYHSGFRVDSTDLSGK